MLCSPVSSHTKIKTYVSWCRDGLSEMHLWGYKIEVLLFASPHPGMEGLAASLQLERELYLISQSPSRKRRDREEKISL